MQIAQVLVEGLLRMRMLANAERALRTASNLRVAGDYLRGLDSGVSVAGAGGDPCTCITRDVASEQLPPPCSSAVHRHLLRGDGPVHPHLLRSLRPAATAPRASSDGGQRTADG